MKNVTVIPFGTKFRAIENGDGEFCQTFIAAKMVNDHAPVFLIDECVAIEDSNDMLTVREGEVVLHGGEVFDVGFREDDDSAGLGFIQRPALSLLAA
jgi:hypothetical protein